MDTMAAFAMGQANRGRELMVFDWNKALALIIEHKAVNASAGLQDDWEWTGDNILKDGIPILNASPYLASTWATPEIEINGQLYECYSMQSSVPSWGSDTCWPKEILNKFKELKEPK